MLKCKKKRMEMICVRGKGIVEAKAGGVEGELELADGTVAVGRGRERTTGENNNNSNSNNNITFVPSLIDHLSRASPNLPFNGRIPCCSLSINHKKSKIRTIAHIFYYLYNTSHLYFTWQPTLFEPYSVYLPAVRSRSL